MVTNVDLSAARQHALLKAEVTIVEVTRLHGLLSQVHLQDLTLRHPIIVAAQEASVWVAAQEAVLVVVPGPEVAEEVQGGKDDLINNK